MLPVARVNLRLALDGPAGDDLLSLARGAGAALVFDCGAKECALEGRCRIHSGEALVGHWLAATTDPALRWVVPSAAGQARPFDAPLQLVAALLAQCVWEPEPMPVPTIEGIRWDVFVSTCSDSGSLGSVVAEALRDAGLSTWHMEDHQLPGRKVRENMLNGLRGCGAMLALLSRGYWQSRHCVEELTTALSEGRAVVAVRVQQDAALTQADAAGALDTTLKALKVEPTVAERTRTWLAGTFDPETIYVPLSTSGKLEPRTVAAIASEVRDAASISPQSEGGDA